MSPGCWSGFFYVLSFYTTIIVCCKFILSLSKGTLVLQQVYSALASSLLSLLL
jgi:hypothetical protein